MTLLVLGFLTLLQDPKKPPKVDQEKVDAAIEKGVQYLRGQMELVLNRDIYLTWERTNQGSFHQKMTELVALTFLHAGVKPEDPEFQKMIDQMTGATLETTYRAAVQAMVLHKLDPRKYQKRIAECGQVLIDSQCQTGQWCYGHSTELSGIPTPKEEPVNKTGGFGKKDPKAPAGPPPLPKIYLKKQKTGCPHGDASNSQYAALGLRACIESGVVIPQEVLTKAKEAWERTQRADGAWDYCRPPGTRQQDQPAGTYGSMTVGGVAALCILKYYLREPVKGDAKIVSGLNWLGKNFTVTQNPGYKHHMYYFLYGMERAGDLYGTEMLGSHEWYVEGANSLIKTQDASGMWWSQSNLENQVVATCFAILFLRRATVPLPKIATGVK